MSPLAPEDEGLGLVRAEPLLPSGIQGGVRAVVVEQVEPHAVGVGTGEEEQVNLPVVGTDLARVWVARGADGLDGVVSQEDLERGLSFGIPVRPELAPDAVPGLGEALFVAIRLLNDLPLQPVGVLVDEAIADRTAVILHVNPVGPVKPTVASRPSTIGAASTFDDVGLPERREGGPVSRGRAG
jgi:hypothetical protein